MAINKLGQDDKRKKQLFAILQRNGQRLLASRIYLLERQTRACSWRWRVSPCAAPPCVLPRLLSPYFSPWTRSVALGSPTRQPPSVTRSCKGQILTQDRVHPGRRHVDYTRRRVEQSPPLACIFGLSRLYFTCISRLYLSTVTLVSRVLMIMFNPKGKWRE